MNPKSSVLPILMLAVACTQTPKPAPPLTLSFKGTQGEVDELTGDIQVFRARYDALAQKGRFACMKALANDFPDLASEAFPSDFAPAERVQTHSRRFLAREALRRGHPFSALQQLLTAPEDDDEYLILLAEAYLAADQPAQALEAAGMAQETDNAVQEALALGIAADTLLAMHHPSGAAALYERAARMMRELHRENDWIRFKLNLIRTHLRSGKLDSSQKALDELDRPRIVPSDPTLQRRIEVTRALHSIASRDFRRAREILESTFQQAEAAGDYLLLEEYESLLSHIAGEK